MAWGSKRIKRVVKSTLAAEALAFSEGCDTAYLISQLTKEADLLGSDTTIHAYTDNKSLYDAVNTTNLISDKRLRVEISSIREMESQHEIQTSWINSSQQLADVLTKKGASPYNIMKTIQEGILEIE